MRIGELSRERLELAAYCGSEAARAVVGFGDRTVPGWPDILVADIVGEKRFRDWVHGLSRWQRAAGAQAAVAAAWAAWRHRKIHHLSRARFSFTASQLRASQAIRVAEAWANCPCEEHKEACRAEGRRLELRARSVRYDEDNFLWVVYLVLSAIELPWGTAENQRGGRHDCRAAILNFASLTDEAAVRCAVSLAIREWALR